MIYYITGGERSGKSSYAQQLALSLSENPTYLATARKWDHDFEKRITRHQQERNEQWKNIEKEVHISKASVADDEVIVLDCITLWLTNIFKDYQCDLEKSLSFAKEELNNLFLTKNTWIIISNEIGMGVHAVTETGRKFVELQGWVNQHLAKQSDKAIFMISGMPMTIKG